MSLKHFRNKKSEFTNIFIKLIFRQLDRKSIKIIRILPKTPIHSIIKLAFFHPNKNLRSYLITINEKEITEFDTAETLNSFFEDYSDDQDYTVHDSDIQEELYENNYKNNTGSLSSSDSTSILYVSDQSISILNQCDTSNISTALKHPGHKEYNKVSDIQIKRKLKDKQRKRENNLTEKKLDSNSKNRKNLNIDSHPTEKASFNQNNNIDCRPPLLDFQEKRMLKVKINKKKMKTTKKCNCENECDHKTDSDYDNEEKRNIETDTNKKCEINENRVSDTDQNTVQNKKESDFTNQESNSCCKPHQLTTTINYNTLRGLPNIGNTCYINTALQIMFNLKELNDVILNNHKIENPSSTENSENHEHKKKKLISAYYALIFSYFSPSSTCIHHKTPSNHLKFLTTLESEKLHLFKNRLANTTGMFRGWGQGDSTEVVMAILDKMNEEFGHETKESENIANENISTDNVLDSVNKDQIDSNNNKIEPKDEIDSENEKKNSHKSKPSLYKSKSDSNLTIRLNSPGSRNNLLTNESLTSESVTSESVDNLARSQSLIDISRYNEENESKNSDGYREMRTNLLKSTLPDLKIKNTPISDLFLTILSSDLFCYNCQRCIKRYDAHWYLYLPGELTYKECIVYGHKIESIQCVRTNHIGIVAREIFIENKISLYNLNRKQETNDDSYINNTNSNTLYILTKKDNNWTLLFKIQHINDKIDKYNLVKDYDNIVFYFSNQPRNVEGIQKKISDASTSDSNISLSTAYSSSNTISKTNSLTKINSEITISHTEKNQLILAIFTITSFIIYKRDVNTPIITFACCRRKAIENVCLELIYRLTGIHYNFDCCSTEPKQDCRKCSFYSESSDPNNNPDKNNNLNSDSGETTKCNQQHLEFQRRVKEYFKVNTTEKDGLLILQINSKESKLIRLIETLKSSQSSQSIFKRITVAITERKKNLIGDLIGCFLKDDVMEGVKCSGCIDEEKSTNSTLEKGDLQSTSSKDGEHSQNHNTTKSSIKRKAMVKKSRLFPGKYLIIARGMKGIVRSDIYLEIKNENLKNQSNKKNYNQISSPIFLHYTLISSGNHLGLDNIGHYIAYIKKENVWCCNDTMVSDYDEMGKGYLLVYELVDEISI